MQKNSHSPDGGRSLVCQSLASWNRLALKVPNVRLHAGELYLSNECRSPYAGYLVGSATDFRISYSEYVAMIFPCGLILAA